ncbi:hypothetical protein F4604DRAFT_1924758 [Suillus subluteus]|nr:hypothetical protein F4604DRAFT_1924758 [Suillus subluteus]
MSKIMHKYMDEMGKTGMGITREDKINMDMKNSFTTKWAIIKEACPWFFDMQELIAECPNQVPVGLRHSQMGSKPNSGFMSDEPDISEGFDQVDHDKWPLSDLDSAADEVPSKQGKSSVIGFKMGPQPGMSKPATTKAPKNPVKRRKKDEFAEIAQAEEVTRQKELKVAKVRIEKDTVWAKAKLAKCAINKTPTILLCFT